MSARKTHPAFTPEQQKHVDEILRGVVQREQKKYAAKLAALQAKKQELENQIKESENG